MRIANQVLQATFQIQGRQGAHLDRQLIGTTHTEQVIRTFHLFIRRELNNLASLYTIIRIADIQVDFRLHVIGTIGSRDDDLALSDDRFSLQLEGKDLILVRIE